MYMQQDIKKCQGHEVGKKMCSRNGKAVWSKCALQMRKWHEMKLRGQGGGISFWLW